MAQTSACYFCGSADSWKHSLVECTMARCVWALEDEGVVDVVSNIKQVEARAWLAELFDVAPHAMAVRIAVVLWAIWYARRKAIHEKEFQSPLSTFSFVNSFVSDLEQEPTRPTGPSRVSRPKSGWIAPPRGFIKINVDAALSKNEAKASAAAIARDEDGCFIGASALVLNGLTDPETVEAIACREGMSLALDLNVTRFRLACDSINVVKSIARGNRGVYGQVVEEIMARKLDFQMVEIMHEGRSSNTDAHNIARSSIYESLGRHVWFVSPPYGVCNLYTPAD